MFNQVKFQKNLMNWFTGKTKKLWLWHPKFYPILGIIEIFLNNKSSHFKLLLNTCHQVQLHKNVYVSRKVQKCCFGAKITHYPILGIMTVFLKNPDSHFEPLFKACRQLQFQKTLIRFRIQFKSDNFLSMPHLLHFGCNKNFSKKGLITFFYLLNSNFLQKIRKTA